MKKPLHTLLILIFQLFLCRIIYAQVDYFSPQYVYKFAEYLYDEGDYLRAAGEFQRYLLLIEAHANNESTLFKIGEYYRLANQPQRAITYFQRIIDEYPQGSYRDSASYQIAYSYFAMGQYDQSLRYIDGHPFQSSDYNERLNIFRGVNYLCLKEWKRAHSIFLSHLNSNDSSDSLTVKLNQLALEGTQLPYKSPFISGLLSSIVPGTGKMYADRFRDGFSSLITVGLTGWQAYEGFRKDGVDSTKGWIYGTLCGIFYLGNIYGSSVAVKIYNEKLEDNLLKKAGITIEAYFN